MASTPEFFERHDLGHPNAQGHQVWADVIIKILTLYKQG
jgi:lysophospholipase L1-like esterase